jgi:phosphate-selective porin
VKLLPAFTATLLLLASAARAAELPSVEDRLRALEAKVGALEQENTALRRQLTAPPAASSSPRPATIADQDRVSAKATAPVVVVPSGHETRLAIGGYIQAQAEFGDAGDARFAGTNDRIYFRRARLNVSGSFAEHFDFKIDGEYGAYTNQAATGLRMQANEIFINWNRYPAANLRIGQLKTAFSAELLSVEYKGSIIERTLGAERVGDGRQLAMEVLGELFNGRVNYIVLAGNGNGANSSANDNSKFLQSAHVDVVVHDSKAAGHLNIGAGVLHSTDNGISKLGPGFDAAPGGTIDNLFVGTRDGWGLDAAWHFSLFDLSTELLRMRYHPVNRVPDASFFSESWQVTASYFIVPSHFQAAVRRDHFDPNTTLAGNATDNWWLGLNYYLKGDDVKFMVDYLVGHPASLPHDHGRVFTRFQIVY